MNGHRPTLDIVATVGPTSQSLAAELCHAGATALRLNASHMDAVQLAAVARACRAAAPFVPMVIDLKGAKLRVGSFTPRILAQGDNVRFALSATGDEIPVPHPEIFGSVSAGDTLGCDDDRLHFRVISASRGVIEAKALHGGTLLPRKGINVIEHPVHLQSLTAADCAAISATLAQAPVAYAFSFMEDGREVAWINEHAPGCAVVGKVERLEASCNTRAIAAATNTLWICRGDLGAQLGLGSMARWVADFEPRDYTIPVLMAGQVLEHMSEHSAPTRTEVCHVFDLWRRGYAGFVLSDETAIGKDPVAAVRTLRALLESFS